MEKIKGVIALSRYKEVLANVAFITILGLFLAFVNSPLRQDWDMNGIILLLIVLLAANFLATTFAFMINDVEDAEDDALDPKKSKRNPISAGRLTKIQGYAVAFVVAGLALVLFLLVNVSSFLVGLSLVVLGFLYSWKKLRLKGLPFLDMTSHAYFLAGGILLSSYLGFSVNLLPVIFPFLMIYMISLSGDLYNEIRDYEVDRKAKLKNTVAIIGLKQSVLLKNLLYVFALVVFVALAVQYLSFLNPVAAIVGIAVILGMVAYTHFFSSRAISDLDNWLLFSNIPLIGFLILAISIFY